MEARKEFIGSILSGSRVESQGTGTAAQAVEIHLLRTNSSYGLCDSKGVIHRADRDGRLTKESPEQN
ncbi:hypothetical protein [Fodinicola acaciae]|uniref:hypothetical protein n=1 Tax=Fodinicola acaciae TaxID=2681555 RepID=UPI0013D29DDD|nr:hypothetical protein [Fodinicola acaciae]